MGDSILEIRELVKNFGAITVNAGINLDVFPGEVHSVIGPNGAGKTTLLAQIAGELLPDSGSIRFAGREIRSLPVHRRALMGIARSFQITSIFQRFSVQNNVAMAVRAGNGHSFRFWHGANRDMTVTKSSKSILERVGLVDRADAIAGRLSYGEQRQLEIAMVLAMRPKLLLLDEPTAGMGLEESARMVALLKDIRGQYPLLLVEHDMDTVFALSDRITVLVYGRVLASGTPAEIRLNPQVQTAYLGSETVRT
jgi:branched-chain amino acid transport system ATP-binding protein